MNSVVIHHASWVVPVSAHATNDGAIATDNERILSIGTPSALRAQYPDATIKKHGSTALIPALINAHIHLELSHLPIPKFRKKVSGFTDWIETLLSKRQELGDMSEEAEKAAEKVLESQHRQGIIALGDIGNTPIGDRLRNRFSGILLHFNECLGRTNKTKRAIIDRAAKALPEKLFTAHAPYSTHADIIQALKKRAVLHNHPFPIHVAEPPSEKEMLCCGTGDLFSFLKGRGFVDDAYKPPAGIDNQGSVQYLHNLGVLDKQTICVHCIHVSPEEVEILAATGTKICLCPGSNRYLNVGKAPLQNFLDHGILPALGTDSLASNPEISLWNEMKLIADDNPSVNTADIFAMATLGGANALGIDHNYGSLSPGKSSQFLAVQVPEDIKSDIKLYEYLVKQYNGKPAWVNEQ